MNISQKGYIATPAQIGELTKTIIAAQTTEATGRGDYLKALVATTTAELGLPPRVNSRKAEKLKPEEGARLLVAFEAVHARFLEAVTEAASAELPTKDKALELNRRTAFARSAASTARSYIKAGNDLTALVPAKVTKAALYVAARKTRPPTLKRLKATAESRSKALVVALLELSETDQREAASELELILSQLTDQLASITGTPTSNMETAIAEHRPFTHKGAVFLPTKTQIIKPSQARAMVRGSRQPGRRAVGEASLT